MADEFKPPLIPAAFFAIVLGLAGLGGGWRLAHQLWAAPAFIGEALMALATLIWAVLVILFALKWIFMREAAQSEAEHPIQCCFIGLAGISTMLIANAALPYSRSAAEILFAAGAVFTLAFGLWRTGILWHGERDIGATTPVLYLPTVGGGFVMAIAASALGYADLSRVAFGAAALNWLAIESVLLHRFYSGPSLPPPLRPTLGILLAPPTVGALAYLGAAGGTPDLVAHILVGYGVFLALLLLRLLPWIMQQPFSASYWGFTFGVTALPSAMLRMVAHGETGLVASLAPWVFAAANLVVGLIALGTVKLLLQRRLLPPAVPAVTAGTPTLPHRTAQP